MIGIQPSTNLFGKYLKNQKPVLAVRCSEIVSVKLLFNVKKSRP